MSESGPDREELRSRGQSVGATIRVGKAGVTEGVVDEADGQLEDRDLVKVRLLRSARAGADREELAEELARRADAELVEVRGNTALLHRP
jgi:RNA-binding protein